jgi:hypothetical protein
MNTSTFEQLFAPKPQLSTPAKPNEPLKLEDFRIGMTVFSETGVELTVVSIDSRNRLPIFAEPVTSGKSGRFLPSSLSLSSPQANLSEQEIAAMTALSESRFALERREDSFYWIPEAVFAGLAKRSFVSRHQKEVKPEGMVWYVILTQQGQAALLSARRNSKQKGAS